ncbi:MAG: GNAT family N-acetyltransferase, partial [Methylococcales bacterium]
MIALRPMGEADLPFLKDLYGSTREQELELTDWTPEQKKRFIAFQFAAQHEHYLKHYTGCEFNVAEVDGLRAGRLYIARWKDEI